MSPVFVTFLAVIFSPAVIFPSFFKLSTTTFLEAMTPDETVFLPLKLPLTNIFPVLLMSPETATFFEVSTVPSLSNFPLIERSSLVLKLPDDFKLSAETLPTTVISPILETFLAVKLPLVKISPVFLISFASKLPFALILPSLVKLSTFRFLAATVPDVTVFLAVKSSFVKIFPVLATFPKTEIRLTEVNAPVLSNFPLISVIPETCIFPELSKFFTLKFPPERTVAREFLKSFAVIFPEALIFPEFIISSVFRFPPVYMLDLFSTFPLRLMSSFA